MVLGRAIMLFPSLIWCKIKARQTQRWWKFVPLDFVRAGDYLTGSSLQDEHNTQQACILVKIFSLIREILESLVLFRSHFYRNIIYIIALKTNIMEL